MGNWSHKRYCGSLLAEKGIENPQKANPPCLYQAKVLTDALVNCSAQEVLEQNTEDRGLGGKSAGTGQLTVVSIR